MESKKTSRNHIFRCFFVGMSRFIYVSNEGNVNQYVTILCDVFMKHFRRIAISSKVKDIFHSYRFFWQVQHKKYHMCPHCLTIFLISFFKKVLWNFEICARFLIFRLWFWRLFMIWDIFKDFDIIERNIIERICESVSGPTRM